MDSRFGISLDVTAIWLAATTLARSGGSRADTGTPAASPAAAAGKALFFDTSLSASGRQSCGTCHVQARAFSGDPATDRGLPVPLGGCTLTDGYDPKNSTAYDMPAQCQPATPATASKQNR